MNTYIWKLLSKPPVQKNKNWLCEILAKNRRLTTKKLLEEFLNPALYQIINVKLTDVKKGVERIEKAFRNREKIIVYSDYDADGICATAIVWETLHDLGASILPYVPHRVKEGYGLSIPAIEKHAKDNVKIIITVDHGVTAVKQIEKAKELGVDVVVTDHHLKPKNLPRSYALVHTTELCGAGVAWRFCWEIINKIQPSYKDQLIEKLELAAIATIADLVPLISANRAIVKIGLEQINKTNRPGLKSLINSARLKYPLRSYEIGHAIAPRINAMGRLEHGIDSLRLLCSKNQEQASKLADLLSKTNKRRQSITTNSIDQAQVMYDETQLVGVLHHESWHEGIIGLIASKLVERHHRPMIAISKGRKISKGSARSIAGFNIVDAIRASSKYLLDAGGHPMAAGFTIYSKHIESFTKSINVYAQKTIPENILTPYIEVECELETHDINIQTLNLIKTFGPYGVGNPQPVFLTRGMLVEDIRGVGSNNQHLKLILNSKNAIGFNFGEKRSILRPGYKIDVVYTIDEDNFNGKNQVQMKIKDFKLKDS